MIRTYLDWLLAVPWSKRSEERLDPQHARAVLGRRPRRSRRRQAADYRVSRGPQAPRRARLDRRSPLGRHPDAHRVRREPARPRSASRFARATGRQFVRMSLGGVRDEAEIRGHRRTYIGALPGRLVRAPPRRRHDESGHPARRGRQARRRLARRSVGGVARGAGPRAEPCVSGSLPRRRTRSVTRGCSSRPPTWPTRFPARCSTGMESDSLRRLHDR